MNGHHNHHHDDDDDDDDTIGASTFASIGMAIADDGSCPRHPHVMLKEVGADGYVYQKESCPACDKEFQTQKLALKDRKKELDRQLEQLGEDDDDDDDDIHTATATAAVDDEASVIGDDIDNLRDNLMQIASTSDKRHRSMTDEEVNHQPSGMQPKNMDTQQPQQQQQPPQRQQQQQQQQSMNNNHHHNNGNQHNMQSMNSNMHNMDGDQGYSRPPLTLESLANQMNMMQQMQDWILRQKETEMNLLRTKVETQQKELLSKEVEIALLKEKLDQQEIRMQQELKLLKLAASQDRRSSKNNKSNKEIHIQELHVSVGGNLNDANGDLDPKMVQAATQAATTAALDRAAAAGNDDSSGSSGSSRSTMPPRQSSSSNNISSSNKPPPTPPKQKNRVVPITPVAPPSRTLSAPPKAAGSAAPPPPPMRAASKKESSDKPAPLRTAAVMSAEKPNNVSASTQPEFTFVPTPTRLEQQKEDSQQREFTFNPTSDSDTNDTDDDDESKDQFDPTSTPWGTAAVPSGKVTRKATPAPGGYSQKTGPLLSQPPSNPNPNRKEPQEAAPSLLQPSHGGHDNNVQALNAAPTGLPTRSQVGDPIRGIPRNLDVDDMAPPTVPLEEDVTIGTYDQRAFESRFGHHVDMDERSVGNTSIGNTVASSTYGEDRQKVVSQTLLDPYGDKGRYSGVVLRSTGMPHGLGRMVYEDDGRTYEGDWRHGRWHGFGTATFANGDSYEGEYRFDQRHGRGKYCWSDGRIYDGEFSEDKRHGKGTFEWPDGATYEGDFHQGQREGHGRYTFSDGGYYTGSWIDGRYEGFGECHWEDGRKYKGEWRAGMAHGQGVETYPDGRIRHDGQWIDDEPIRVGK